jgi:tRNA threonylcarbamoyladenosine biosynthesis protein TsaE
MALIILDSVEATQAYGELWARGVEGGEVIALHGILGSGKTQIVKGLARGLGFTGEVTSPTYTLIHEYRGGRLPLFHLDLYRLSNENDAARAGVDEYIGVPGAVTVIEWADRIAGLLPSYTRHWELEVVSMTERVIARRS